MYARSFGFGFDFTSKNSPKFVLLILPIEFAKFTIKLFFVGTFLKKTKPLKTVNKVRVEKIRQTKPEAI